MPRVSKKKDCYEDYRAWLKKIFEATGNIRLYSATLKDATLLFNQTKYLETRLGQERSKHATIQIEYLDDVIRAVNEIKKKNFDICGRMNGLTHNLDGLLSEFSHKNYERECDCEELKKMHDKIKMIEKEKLQIIMDLLAFNNTRCKYLQGHAFKQSELSNDLNALEKYNLMVLEKLKTMLR